MTSPTSSSSRTADCVRLACLLEASAAKPGNVHPGASFHDLTYSDFVRAASAIAPAFDRAAERSVGEVVLDAVERSLSSAGSNVNLGIVLLIAPLACVPREVSLHEGIGDVLGRLTRDDAEKVYTAIRLANPGGLGKVDREDVTASPTMPLGEAMRLAADRDRIALQYVTCFADVLAGADRLASRGNFARNWEQSLIQLHLELMAESPDSLIARKCGPGLAGESAQRARAVLEAGWPVAAEGRELLATLDAWLRADGNRRNPGTTADLIAACVFTAFRESQVEWPSMPDVTRLASFTPPSR